eukprot:COSAG02_NODE_65536_length_258_cov_0.314465_1_plen_86_part_11
MPASKKVFTKVTFSTKTSTSMKKQMTKIAKQTVLGIAETTAVGLQTNGSPTVPALGLDHTIVRFHGNLLQTKQGVQDPNDYSSAPA